MVPPVLFIAVGLAAGLPGAGCNVVSSPLPSSPPIRRYVETEEENEDCLIYPEKSDIQADRPGASCPAGYYYIDSSNSASGLDCDVCPFGTKLRTHMPYRSFCPLCILCSVCSDGYEVEAECTRLSQTKCRQIEPDLLTVQPSMMVPPSVSGPPDDPGPAEDDDVSPPSDPLRPEIDEESSFHWVVILVLFIMVLLVLLILYFRERSRRKQLKKEKTELEAELKVYKSRTRPDSLPTASEHDSSDGQAMTDLTDDHRGSRRPTSPVSLNGSSISLTVPDGAGRPIGSSVGNGVVVPIGSTVPYGAGGPIDSSMGNGTARLTGSTKADGPNINPSELGGFNRPHSAVLSNGASGGPTVERDEVGNQYELETLVPLSGELP